MGIRSLRWNLSVLFVISVLWKPAYTEDKCTAGCIGSPSGGAFLSGHKYNYAVEGTVSLYLSTADKQETSVKLQGHVAVSALGNCAHVLKVNDLSIFGPDGQNYGKLPGLEKPVRFTLQNGKVGPEICAENGDTRRSLNIKRAIISLLQTEQKSSTQIDFFGACPTIASSSQEGPSLLVHRSRDLSRCAHREQSGFHSAVFNPTAEIKSTMILQSTLYTESKVTNGIPEKVAASEEYLYKPFSVGENGARAKVNTKLTLTGQATGADNGNFAQTHTIIFEAPHGNKMDKSNTESALKIVKETAQTVASEASSLSAGSFAQTIRILRTCSKDDLQNVFNQVKGNTLERRVFLDALFRVGSAASTTTVIELSKSNQYQPLEYQLALLSLANAKHVDDETLKAASTLLLNMPKPPKQAFLGISSLVRTYCLEHNCHAHDTPGIGPISGSFEKYIVSCKPQNKEEEDYLVTVMRSMRNFGHLEDTAIDKLIKCAADNTVKARVRVTALEAFTADPCSPKLKKAALDLLKNVQLDSEIRIKAYLAVIACPCSTSANELKTLLNTEPSHQVGRFITTSLRHIRASSNPDKKLAREHYGLISTPMKFSVDDRKFSFYREASYSDDTLGVGGTLEQSVIYSQDSFIPRSASLNLTAEVFGHSLNVFEVGGRQGNLNRVVEHFLGPKGYFRQKETQKIVDDLRQRFNEAQQKAKNIRSRRSIKTEVDSFNTRIKAETIHYNNELDLDIYVRLFGTEAVFLSFGDNTGFDFNKALDNLFNVFQSGFSEIKHFNQELRSHLLFLDAELAYPTSTGLPLKLDLIGTATGRFEVSTNIDIAQIMRNPESAKIDIKLVPSTDVEIAGLFVVDADVVSTGLKVNLNLHSSTGGHLIAKVIENGNGFDLQYALPIDKQEVITASTDIVLVTAEKGQKAKFISLKPTGDRKEFAECFDQLSGLLGLTLCADVSLPFQPANQDVSSILARYPLTGPAKLKVYLQKNDLRGYHIKGVRRTIGQNGGNFELLFEAEGTQNRRTWLYGELINEEKEKSLKLSLESPIYTASGAIAYKNNPNELAAMFKANLADQEYYGKIGFSVNGNNAYAVYKPVIEYELPDQRGKQVLRVDGEMIKESKGSSTLYTLQNLKINMPNTNENIDINGKFTQNERNVELDLKAKKGEHVMLLSAYLSDADVKLEFQNTLNPYVNFKLLGHFEVGQTIHNDIDLYYGGDLKNTLNRITFNQLWKFSSTSNEDFNLITKNKFEILALPFKIQADADIDPKKVDIEVKGVYFDKNAEFDLEARAATKAPGDYSIKMEANSDNQGVELFAKRDIVSPEKSNLENYLIIKNFGKYELSGVVLHKYKPNDVNVGAIGHFKVAAGGKTEDIKFDIGAIENNKLYSSHAKLDYSKGNLLDYLLKVNRGPSTTAELKFNLKDTFSTNGQFKSTEADGKGNGVIIVDFKKSNRKIKGDVSFQLKHPIYNLDMDLFFNFDKDNNDKVHISTKTNTANNNIESKNYVEIGNKKTEFNLKQTGLDSGKSQSVAEVVLDTGRCLTLKYDRDFDYKDNNINGHGELVLSDASKHDGPSSSITYSSKVFNTNFDKEVINYEGQLVIQLTNGKQLHHNFNIKNTPSGQKSVLEFKGDVAGNLIPAPASLQAYCEYTNDETFEGTEKYKIKGNYGNELSFEYAGDSDISFPDSGDSKYQDNNALSLHLNHDNKPYDIKVTSNLLVQLPDNQDELLEFSVLESFQVNSNLYKFDSNGKIGAKSGYGKVKLVAPQIDAVGIDMNYNSNNEGETKSGKVEVKTTYGKGKNALLAVEANCASQDYNIKVKAQAPDKELVIGQTVELELHTKVPGPENYAFGILILADGHTYYKLDSQVIYSKSHPLVDLKFSGANSPKPSRVYLQGTALSSSQGKLSIKLENINNINLEATSEAIIQKNLVSVKFIGNSNELGLKNYKAEISSQDAGAGKRLEFLVFNDNKNLLSGSTSLISKEEGPKTIIEGSGSVKVKDEQKSANFKYIRTLLTEGTEQGVETFFNVAIGGSSYVMETRATNLEYKYSYVYCEEKKQCAHAEVQSKVVFQKPSTVQHLLNAGLDLRKLGFSPEFGLQVSNEVSDKKLPQYNLNLYVNKDDKRYHLNVYDKPEIGNFASGVVLTLPQRTLALESLLTYPKDKSLPFPLNGMLAFYTDKNKPTLKTAITLHLDMTADNQQQKALAELKFSHPKLGKEASLKASGSIVHPNANSYTIETKAVASFPPLGPDRESKFYLDVNPNHLKFFVITPIVKVIDVEATATINDKLQQSELTFSLLGGKHVQTRTLIKDYQYYEFTTGYSEDTTRKLSVIGHIQPEQMVDISADIILPGEKKNILHGSLYLQDNSIKTDYGFAKENVKYFSDALKVDIDNLLNNIKHVFELASNEFKTTLDKVTPYFNQIVASYKDEMEKLKVELANDQTLKEICQALSDVAQFFAKIISDITKALEPIIEKFIDIIKETSAKIEDIYSKQIEPQVKQFIANITNLLKEYLEGVIDLMVHYAAIVTDFLEKHKPELEDLTNTFSEIFKDLTRIIVAQLKEFRTKLDQIYTDISQQINDFPLMKMLQEKWNELAVPEQLLNMIDQVYFTLRESFPFPSEKTKEFGDALIAYMKKKLRYGQQVDDAAEFRTLYEKLVAAVWSNVEYVSKQLAYFGSSGSVFGFNTLDFTKPGQTLLPAFGGIPSLSLLNQLKNGDFVDPMAFIRAYRPRSLDPFDEIPAKMRGVVVHGQHFFTFDGRHITFPGSCRYILAHDFVDRNFTFVLTLLNGEPKGVALVDQSGTFLELKDNGQVTVNGAVTHYPVIEKEVFAFKKTNGIIGLGSKYGAFAFCTSKLEVCYFEASGFYHGKLRGLLGNGNNEPFDDFTMPSTKITTSESEFANSYRMSTTCPQVKTPVHSENQMHSTMPPACEQVFGKSSPLKYLSLFMDAAPFRQACIHAVSASSTDALKSACDIGKGYAALALTGLLPAVIPDVCLKCEVAGSTKDIGDTFEVTAAAGKKLDLIVTFETTKSNENNYKNIVTPLVLQVISALKPNYDIKLYLVGITSKYPYPIVYDTDPTKLSAKVQFDDESRYNHISQLHLPEAPQVANWANELIDYVNAFNDALGLTNVVVSYNSVLEIPHRPGAVKHTINVVGEHCKSPNFLIQLLRNIAYDVAFSETGYTHSIIAATPGLTIGAGKNAAQVVGYSNKGVWMLGDKQGQQALKSALETPVDACIDFVEETNDGLVLSANNFHAMNDAQQKVYFQTAVAAIKDQIVQTPTDFECLCTYVNPFKGDSVCFVKEKPLFALK